VAAGAREIPSFEPQRVARVQRQVVLIDQARGLVQRALGIFEFVQQAVRSTLHESRRARAMVNLERHEEPTRPLNVFDCSTRRAALDRKRGSLEQRPANPPWMR
jgi:hypothetical protein